MFISQNFQADSVTPYRQGTQGGSLKKKKDQGREKKKSKGSEQLVSIPEPEGKAAGKLRGGRGGRGDKGPPSMQGFEASFGIFSRLPDSAFPCVPADLLKPLQTPHKCHGGTSCSLLKMETLNIND